MSSLSRAPLGPAPRWATVAAVPALFAIVALVFWTRAHLVAHRGVGALVAVAALCFIAWVGRHIGHLEARLEESSLMLAESHRLARIGAFRWDARTGVNDWTEELFHVHGL